MPDLPPLLTGPAYLTGLDELPADQVVAALHPYNQLTGQHSRSAAAQIAELIRYLNHATIDARDGAQAIPEPADADAILHDLATALTRLPQLLNQVAGRCIALASQPDARTTTGQPPRAAANDIAGTILATTPYLRTAADTVRRAAETAGRLYLHNPDDE